MPCVIGGYINPITEIDFYPLQFIPNIPERKFDNSDANCKSYGLSLYTTLNAAREAY